MNILRCTMSTKTTPAFEKILQKAFEERDRSAQIAKFPSRFDKEDLKKRLSPQQYLITQERGTERAFSGELPVPHCASVNGCKIPSLSRSSPSQKPKFSYTCIVCSADLFSSSDKFDSGCGWPAFTRAISDSAVAYFKDTSFQMVRIEAVCGNCGAHLGHVFDDGPLPTGIRFCINAVCLGINSPDESQKSD